MRRVFTKFLGSALFSANEAVGVKLADGMGAVEEVVMTPEIAEDVAHALMLERAHAIRIREQDVPTVGSIGEPLRERALRVDALEYRPTPPSDGRPILVLHTVGGAEYHFVFPKDYAERVKALGSRNP